MTDIKLCMCPIKLKASTELQKISEHLQKLFKHFVENVSERNNILLMLGFCM